MLQTVSILTRKPSTVSILDPSFAPALKAPLTAPVVISAMSNAASLAFQLPEAPKDVVKDLDEVSQAWLRILRAPQGLLHATRSPPKFPAKPWTPEGRPPTMKKLQILEDFYAFVSEREASFEIVWERLASKTGRVTLASLRNQLGLLGTKESRTGTWPSHLPSAEQVYTAMSALLRVDCDDDRGLPRDRFILLRKWMDAEARINNILDAHGVDQMLLAECSGARLQALIKIVAHRPQEIKSREDILKFVEIVLELEPRATTSFLLLHSGGGEANCAALFDMVLRQGLLCIENKSLLSLMSFCESLLDRLIRLGSPCCLMTFKDLKMGNSSPGSPKRPDAMADIPVAGKESQSSMCSTAKSELPLLQLASASILETSMPTSTKSPKLPLLTSSMAKSGLDKVDKFAMYLDRTALSDDIGGGKDAPKSSCSSKPSTPKKDEVPCREEKSSDKKISRRHSSMPDLMKNISRSRTQSFDVADRLESESPLSPGSSASTLDPGSPCRLASEKRVDKFECKKVPRRKSMSNAMFTTRSRTHSVGQLLDIADSPVTSGGTLIPGSPGSPATRKSIDNSLESNTLQRRSTRTKTLGMGTRRRSEPEPGLMSRMTSAEWELNSCQVLWFTIPPQTITFAIAASLHSVGSRKLGLDIIRPAWSLLDKANAVECAVGNIGIKRLRLEMDTLLDQCNRTLHFGKDNCTEELASFLDTVRFTMLHLQRLCEGEPKFAQVAVLYGIAFIAEVMCTWAEQIDGGVELATTTRDLSFTLSPHLQQLFQRRL